ncbi:cell surface immobilization antigen (macronuclear) [Tetrahymena thermophila SB210]|uniref:Cell surface immobilization antigen n=1 Tax=Tetrahymena thermophila (strain SB210) TaxID=312017 RepID=Q23JD6_TETTS|nr:cell surface immobilization antigen [Tetrahymena thermophila SB210]EAR96568.1 cell surface immobilization antigen [Tetrahymena thermophila SB210]|eukprot:XP_001016813.1 cell surface immobilization antigen [Tetrahymena thermophila SB210]
MIKKLLVLSLTVALIFTTPGADVTCNSTTDSTTCGSAGASTWITGSTAGKFKIADCSAVGSSLTNIFDTFCLSCPQGGNSNIYANASQSGCRNTPINNGVNIQCQQGSNCSTSCPALPLAFTWKTGLQPNQCMIESCYAAPIPNSGLTFILCGSCSPNGDKPNSYGTACVKTTGGFCDRNQDWTDDDCKICNAGGKNSANIKASSDKTQCVAAASSSSSSVIAVSALLIASLLI